MTANAGENTATEAAAAAASGGRVNRRKARVGTVVSAKSDKTIVVAVIDRVSHRRYQKIVRRSRKLHAHDETNDANEGDVVRIQETRPLSKTKRWRLVEVVERAR